MQTILLQNWHLYGFLSNEFEHLKNNCTNHDFFGLKYFANFIELWKFWFSLACWTGDYGRNLSILVLLGKENNCDGLSRGDWTDIRVQPEAKRQCGRWFWCKSWWRIRMLHKSLCLIFNGIQQWGDAFRCSDSNKLPIVACTSMNVFQREILLRGPSDG